MSEHKLLSVVVPAYKQGKTIKENLRTLRDALREKGYKFEIVCVVDGFVDDTFDQAKKVSGREMRIIGYDENKGKGHAVRFGMAKSKGQVVAFVDAGLEIPPESLIMGLEHFDWYKADIVVGSKRHPVSKVEYPFVRKVLSVGYQLLVMLLFGLRVRDTQVGLKIFKREILDKILSRLLVKRYAFDIEMLAVSKYFGFGKIYEAPVEILYSFEDLTHASTRKEIFRMIWDTAAVFYRLKILHYYDDKNRKNWISQ